MTDTVTDTAEQTAARRRIYLTKVIAIPMDCIQRIYRATDGGSYVVTDRGTTKVLEPTEQIEAYMADAADGKAVNEP